jgi:uncharacterized protein YodC (DUF2158 family)
MANTFNPGDTVRLKSGGPLMTVTAVDDPRVYVTWFDESNKRHSEIFPAIALEVNDATVGVA